MRFRCLDRSGGILQNNPQKVAAFFVACCVLHNISMNHGCVDDINEEILEDLRRRDVELRWDWTLEGPGVAMRDVLLMERVDGDGVGGGGRGTTGAGGAFGGPRSMAAESSPDLRRCAREAAATSPPG